MKKKGLIYGIIALVILCIIYGGVTLYLEHSQKKEEQKKEAEKTYVTNLADVAAISYDKDGQELSFTKKDGVWNYDGDPLFPVKQTKLDSFVSTASKLEALRNLEGGDGLRAYGLDKPVRKIHVTGKDGNETVIYLGNTTEDGNYYAMIEGENTPYLISSALYNATDGELHDFMELEEFPAIAGKDIKTITITQNGNTRHFIKKTIDEKKGTVEWYKDSADSPDNKQKDNSALNVLADSLSSLKVKDCVNYKVTEQELTQYGLDQPAAQITYTYEKNGKEETFQLSVGALNNEAGSYYTRTKDSKKINEIEKESIEKCLNVDKKA
ncbi:DUF4340 domain-containing protein [Clostridium sp. HBUAS56010]|uniref:DUF4340 domain-containing protein n=1 Tax=Clostridium sp. HBUAS56010 TaxID=2571127 RepID=UPI00117819C6|nr:DUF4340 domain-containing protein [Clostridium sp. HBUAS56010]